LRLYQRGEISVNEKRGFLIHHQGVICCVALDRFSLRRTVCTSQSALLGAFIQHLAGVQEYPSSIGIIADIELIVDLGRLLWCYSLQVAGITFLKTKHNAFFDMLVKMVY
jgi:hypothetical protein